MTDRKILENAPEGATHVDDGGAYFKRTKKGDIFWWVNQVEWMPVGRNRFTRSLADIKRIVDLERVGNEYRILVADLRYIYQKE